MVWERCLRFKAAAVKSSKILSAKLTFCRSKVEGQHALEQWFTTWGPRLKKVGNRCFRG